MSKNKFKIGDRVRRLHSSHASFKTGDVGTVEALNVYGTNVRLAEDSGGFNNYSHKVSSLELVEAAKPTYPNPPHKHAEVIKAWADGAKVEKQISGIWYRVSRAGETFNQSIPHRIKPAKSAKDIKLEELQVQAQKLADEIKELQNASN